MLKIFKNPKIIIGGSLVAGSLITAALLDIGIIKEPKTKQGLVSLSATIFGSEVLGLCVLASGVNDVLAIKAIEKSELWVNVTRKDDKVMLSYILSKAPWANIDGILAKDLAIEAGTKLLEAANEIV